MGRKTNTKFVTDLMDFSQQGAMMHAFVLEAIARYANQVANMPAEELRKQFGDHSLIGANVWAACAVEARDAIEAHLKH